MKNQTSPNKSNLNPEGAIPLGVIKFDKCEWKLGIPQTLKNENRW